MTVNDLISARNMKEEINTWRKENGLASDSIIGMTLIISKDYDDLLNSQGLRLDDEHMDMIEKEPMKEECANINSKIRIAPLRRMVRKVLRIHPHTA